MEIIDFIPTTVLSKAKQFNEFRSACKAYLAKHGHCYDKFTIVKHDAYIGYISEYLISKYLEERLPSQEFEVLQWEDKFDMELIHKAVYTDDVSQLDYVHEYFYDQCDIIVRHKEKEVLIDVKTALTKLEPQESWDFLYPVVQAQKGGKDYSILAYCLYQGGLLNVKKIIIAGVCELNLLKKKKIIYAGQYTKFGTKSQIDNYETKLSVDYIDVNNFIKDIERVLYYPDLSSVVYDR